MSKVTFLRIVIGLFGVVFIILTFWLSVYFHLSISTKIVIALAFALATIFAEFIIAMDNLEKRLKVAFPSLELSLKEQIAINETIMLYNKLKRKKTNISTRIAIKSFENIHHLLKQAEKGGDFTFQNIYLAKMIILAELKPGQSFKIVSNLIEPFYWKSGKDETEHAKLNYTQAKKGIHIERIFILKNDDDLSKMREIMKEQEQNNINVYYIFKNSLNKLLPYASFAISEELSCGVISHREDLLGKVVITSNNEVITELSWQFDNIKKQANKFNAAKKSLYIK
jgi:hypothetical protein